MIPDPVRVEDHHVRVGTHLETALVGKPQLVRRHGCHHPNGLIERQLSRPDKLRQQAGEGTGSSGMALPAIHDAVASQHDAGMAQGHVHVRLLHHIADGKALRPIPPHLLKNLPGAAPAFVAPFA